MLGIKLLVNQTNKYDTTKATEKTIISNQNNAKLVIICSLLQENMTLIDVPGFGYGSIRFLKPFYWFQPI